MHAGKIQLRMVRIYVKHDRLALRLVKKHIRGVISTYKECKTMYLLDLQMEFHWSFELVG